MYPLWSAKPGSAKEIITIFCDLRRGPSISCRTTRSINIFVGYNSRYLDCLNNVDLLNFLLTPAKTQLLAKTKYAAAF